MSKFDPRQAVNAAIESGTAPDQTKVQSGGGGDYVPPPEGRARLRFVGYFELGKQKKVYKGVESFVDKVDLVFELSGKNYPPKEFDGVKVPHRVTVNLTLSQSEKAVFTKVFAAMREGKPTVTHMAQMLGDAFIGDIFHDKWTGSDGKERTSVTLRNPNTGLFTIALPRRMNDEEEWVDIPVAEPITEIKAFLWNYPSIEMWNSIHIPGEYGEGKTKNVIQEKIMKAQNWIGSPMYNLLQAGGAVPDIPDAASPADSKKVAESAGRSPNMDLDDMDDDIPF